ncbi:MAG: hypothetical protein CM15mP68_5640 [Pseudomonadota bacterium]|nr:MAG: hypothetical protein CM15mP68_5640 [Pseudomonadota bacterium]
MTAQLEGDMVGFIVEVQQGGIFHIEGVEANQLAQILGIACPTTLFPYLRESVDGLVVKGGFTTATSPGKFRSAVCTSHAKPSATKSGDGRSTSAGGTDPVTH